jgi:quercetin dioxygenase-like cupin family protein
MGMQSSCISGVAVSVAVVLGACLVSAASQTTMSVIPLVTDIAPGPDKQVVALFTGPGRKLVQITLRNGATLDAHNAPVPITIQCVAGSGTLTVAGQGAAMLLKPGVLVTIEPGVVHEIVGAPSVSVLLTQFTER